MILKVELSEHEYNNIMAVDSINLGRMPYKGIVMSAINAIKRGEVQEPTPENDLRVDCIDRQTAITLVCKNTKEILKDTVSLEVKLSDDYLYENIAKIMSNSKVLPSVTPQEPTTKNDLGVDCVSRQAVDRLACEYLTKATDENIAFYEHFLDLPSVTPQESILDKIRAEIHKAWCTHPQSRYEEGLKDQALRDVKIIDKYRAESEARE